MKKEREEGWGERGPGGRHGFWSPPQPTKKSCRFMSARAAQKVGRSVTSSTMWPIPKKTDNGRLITGYACDSRTADAEFLLAKRQYIAATGRVRGADDVIAYHVRQSFRPGEITPEEANRLGVEFAKRFTKGNHAFVVCTHIDKSHIHNHIIWSSVSLEYDRKFRNFWGSTKAVRRLSDTICIENGLSIVENPKPHGKSYNKWLGDQAKPSHRELLRVAIDNALSQSPADFEERC